MPACARCAKSADLGALCRSCASAVAPCDGLIADHLRSTIAVADAAAWAIDGFGHAHALAEVTMIGRQPEVGVIALAASVSREHAELRRDDRGWTVRDLGSRNGTFVDGKRISGRVALPAHAHLRLGDVALWFIAEPAAPIATLAAGKRSLATGGASGLMRYLLAHAAGELCVVAGVDPTGGGALLSRTTGAATWTERGLAPLEFQLLRTLCTRAADEASAPSQVRGCVATKQLARDLPFQSRFANEENVRQVVRRLRAALAEAGAPDVLAVAPGRGYYVACAVRTEV